MAARGLYATTDLLPLMAERGIELSREQVYRLVTQQPERINVYTLAALCDALDVEIGELIEPVVESRQVPKRADTGSAGVGDLRPTRARLTDRSVDTE